MPHMLVIGDSEAGVFQQAAQTTLNTFGLTTEVNSLWGRRLRDIPPLLASALRPTTDVVIITGITCELWEFMPLVHEMGTPTLARLSDTFHPEIVATQMEDIVSTVLSINPTCFIYLLLPPVKELYLFNKKILSNDKYAGYRSIISGHPIFNRTAMAKSSVVAYQRSLALKDPRYNWRRTDFILGSHAFNKYYEGIVGKKGNRPHIQYLQGEISELYSPLLSDGLHYTPLFVKILLKTIVPKCSWLGGSVKNKSLGKRSVSRSRKSRSTSRALRNRYISRSRRNRSSSRSRRNKSRSRSRSRSGSISRRNRSISSSRKNRSTSKTRHSRSSPKDHANVPQKFLAERNLLPTPDVPKTKRIKDNTVLSQGYSNPVRSTTFSAHNFAPIQPPTPTKVNIPTPSANMDSIHDQVGEHLYSKFLEFHKSLQHNHEEEYRAFKAFPELHSSYEMFYEQFLSEYYKTYGMNKPDEHKDQRWTEFWSIQIQIIKNLEWKKKKENLEEEFLKKAKMVKASQPASVVPLASTIKPIRKPESSSESFSVEWTITLLEQISTKLGMLGPALLAILTSAKELDLNDKGLGVFTEDENLTLIKMVTDKMKTLQKTSPPALVLDLTKALDWTEQLLKYAKNPPKKKKELNLLKIAKASVGKDSSYILNLIKTALSYEGLPPKSKEEINEMFLSVCNIHFKISMEEK